MKIKLKLQLGLGLLFFLTLIIGVLAAYYLNRISADTNALLKDNYESLQYAHNMSDAIENDRNQLNGTEIKALDRNLRAQENNITEAGEAEQTAIIRDQYNLLRTGALSQDKLIQAKQSIKKAIKSIENVNTQAIYRKYQAALKTSKKATIYVGFITTLCLLIGFSFIVNFPGYIANPILELTEGIKAISNKNYKQRLEFRSNDEFGELTKAFNSMAKVLDEYESSNLAKILFEKRRIETIIDNMSDAIIGLDEKKHILFVNSLGNVLLGLPDEKLIGQYAPDIALRNDLMRTLLADDHKKELKIYADEKESYFSKDIIEVKNEEETIGQVIVLKNITSFHELDQAKTNFIATISHELKTPIASIKMSLKLLEDQRVGQFNLEQQQLLNNIREDSNRLLKITGELLNLAQVETGNIQLNFVPSDPKTIVDYAVNSVKFQAEQKSINIVLELDPNLPQVQADVEKTAWVLINFLSNALRYSPERSKIIVSVHKNDKAVEFIVKDYGQGIDEKYQQHLFERYFQVPTDGRNKSGTGLGLSISKDFIEAQQGQIFVESEIGSGSSFGFQLPYLDRVL